jgi:hypothetical protein
MPLDGAYWTWLCAYLRLSFARSEKVDVGSKLSVPTTVIQHQSASLGQARAVPVWCVEPFERPHRYP